MTLSEISLLCFTLFNGLRVVSYLPQIWRVSQDRHGAQAISCLTWSLWVGANGSTAVYAWVNLNDPWLALLNGGNTLCCCAVITITVWKRWTYGRRHAATYRFGAQAGSGASRRRFASVSPGPRTAYRWPLSS